MFHSLIRSFLSLLLAPTFLGRRDGIERVRLHLHFAGLNMQALEVFGQPVLHRTFIEGRSPAEPEG